MEDFINCVPEPDLRRELLRLWRLYPKMPVPIRDGGIIIWPDLKLDLCKQWGLSDFLYYVDDESSEALFHERLEQFK